MRHFPEGRSRRLAWGLLLGLNLVAWSGCAMFKRDHGDKTPKSEASQPASTNHFASSVSAAAQETTNAPAAAVVVAAAPDNTVQNRRDGKADTLTPMDQGDSDTDRRITRDLRVAVVRGNGGQHYSFSAKNIKIITINSEVTLRGVVANATEKASIQTLAENTPGVQKVHNQLTTKH